MKRQLMSGLIGIAALVGLVRCGASELGQEYDEALASASFTGHWLYDAGTLCTVGGATMHCCPPGMAMIGAHVSNNVFKCGQLTSIGGARTLDLATMRNGVRACPVGSLMVGMHVAQSQLACQAPHARLGGERIDRDSHTADGTMRVCPAGHAMSGIDVDTNLFSCAS